MMCVFGCPAARASVLNLLVFAERQKTRKHARAREDGKHRLQPSYRERHEIAHTPPGPNLEVESFTTPKVATLGGVAIEKKCRTGVSENASVGAAIAPPLCCVDKSSFEDRPTPGCAIYLVSLYGIPNPP